MRHHLVVATALTALALPAAAHASYQAGVQTQLRGLPVVAVNAGFNYSWSAHFHSQTAYGDDHFSLITFNELAGTISPYVGLLFPVWGNRLVGELLYNTSRP